MDPAAPLDLDVRPIISAGQAPLSTVLSAVGRLEPGQALRVLAPFEPLPLYRILERQGFEHHSSHDSGGTWTILFIPRRASAARPVAHSETRSNCPAGSTSTHPAADCLQDGAQTSRTPADSELDLTAVKAAPSDVQ